MSQYVCRGCNRFETEDPNMLCQQCQDDAIDAHTDPDNVEMASRDYDLGEAAYRRRSKEAWEQGGDGCLILFVPLAGLPLVYLLIRYLI